MSEPTYTYTVRYKKEDLTIRYDGTDYYNDGLLVHPSDTYSSLYQIAKRKAGAIISAAEEELELQEILDEFPRYSEDPVIVHQRFRAYGKSNWVHRRLSKIAISLYSDAERDELYRILYHNMVMKHGLVYGKIKPIQHQQICEEVAEEINSPDPYIQDPQDRDNGPKDW